MRSREPCHSTLTPSRSALTLKVRRSSSKTFGPPQKKFRRPSTPPSTGQCSKRTTLTCSLVTTGGGHYPPQKVTPSRGTTNPPTCVSPRTLTEWAHNQNQSTTFAQPACSRNSATRSQPTTSAQLAPLNPVPRQHNTSKLMVLSAVS